MGRVLFREEGDLNANNTNDKGHPKMNLHTKFNHNRTMGKCSKLGRGDVGVVDFSKGGGGD